jgi:hypothetical protein
LPPNFPKRWPVESEEGTQEVEYERFSSKGNKSGRFILQVIISLANFMVMPTSTLCIAALTT